MLLEVLVQGHIFQYGYTSFSLYARISRRMKEHWDIKRFIDHNECEWWLSLTVASIISVLIILQRKMTRNMERCRKDGQNDYCTQDFVSPIDTKADLVNKSKNKTTKNKCKRSKEWNTGRNKSKIKRMLGICWWAFHWR